MELYKRTLLQVFLVAGIALSSFNIQAREIAGVNIPETAKVAGQILKLNGAGIRSKFLFKIYVASFYLENKTNSAKEILAHVGPKRIGMNFKYSELTKDSLVSAWNEGFENNIPSHELEALKPRIDQFNNMFETVKSGDVIYLDYIPGEGTQVTIKGDIKGHIEGADFYHALMSIWLGKNPIDSTLKLEMLGIVDNDNDDD